MSENGTPIVGIDLGTTNCAVGQFRGGAVRLFPNALDDVLTPSVVALDERTGHIVVGRTAKDILAASPQNAAALFKRGMGTDLSYSVASTRYSAVELSTLMLKTLREDAERALGTEVVRAVVTVPAYFNEAQRFATMKAGELAGLDVERVLNEPTAAAIAHGLHNRETDGTILVFDLGGGTFDVCVMERFEGTLEVRGVAGESMLGGEDFTRRIASLALSRCDATYERTEMVDPDALALLLKRAEIAKRRLSDQDAQVIVVPPVEGAIAAPVDVPLSRADIEEACQPLVDRLRGPCRAAVSGAGLNRTDIDEVILVGGATRMPAVRSLVEQLFGRSPLDGIDPDRAIVHGAAIQAALLDDDEAVGDMMVTDVASHSLGTEVSKRFGARVQTGYFSPVIHRNSIIPTSQMASYRTMDDGQTVMSFAIYEGESRYVKDNRKIGELEVKGIPRGPAGQEVRCRFTFDLNGILEVELTIAATGKTIKKVFHRESKVLSEAQLKAAAARIARIRRDPADQPHVRDAMARAELLIREAAPEARARLESALDILERALDSRVPADIEEAVELLRSICEQIDHGERW